MKHQMGSALIIAVFIISAVGSVALGIGRLIYLQIGSANAYEKGVYAYYAAESGIEEGFLRYRYNQGANLPYGDEFSYKNDYAFRNNLTQVSVISTGVSGNGISANEPVSNIFDQIYDLRMNPRVRFIGEGASPSEGITTSTSPEFSIRRDESKKFDLDFSKTNIFYDLYFKPVLGSEGGSSAIFSDSKCVVLEIKIVGNNSYVASGGANIYPLREKKKLFFNGSSDCQTKYSANDVIDLRAPRESYGNYYPMSGNSYYTILGLKSSIWGSENLSKDAEIFIKPIGADVRFAIGYTPDGDDQGMLGSGNVITANGYYMGIRRGLVAKVDRQSGSLYDLFDYVLYKAE